MAATQVEIRDGATVLMRPIEPKDKRALADGFSRLTPESRYRRFFAPLSALSGTDLRYLTEVDHSDHEAIIALDPDGGEIVGVARYIRSEDPRQAEVAVTVADDWHGRGVGTALLEALIVRARSEGIREFLALVLPDNAPALELFQQLSAVEVGSKLSESGYLELRLALPATDSVAGTPFSKLLRETASGRLAVRPWRVLRRHLRNAVSGDNRPSR